MSFSDRPRSFAGSQERGFIAWFIRPPERCARRLPVRSGFPRVHFVLPRLAPGEARDEPGAGDAVDFRPLTRHPARVRARRLRVERAARGLPTLFNAALQVLRGEAAPGERSCDALADLVPAHAVRDDAACARQLP